MMKGQRFSCFFRIPHSAFLLVFNAPVAQWIERQPPELKAAGSNPAGRTKYIKGLQLKANLNERGNVMGFFWDIFLLLSSSYFQCIFCMDTHKYP